MSITSLMRTLTATSVGGRLLRLVSGGDAATRFTFEEDSKQTSAMTSLISAGFNCKGCCSLIHIKNKMRLERKQVIALPITTERNPS